MILFDMTVETPYTELTALIRNERPYGVSISDVIDDVT